MSEVLSNTLVSSSLVRARIAISYSILGGGLGIMVKDKSSNCDVINIPGRSSQGSGSRRFTSSEVM